MQEERIRRTGTNSTNSVDLEQFVDVHLKQHTKVYPFPSVMDTIDQRQQFEEEREKCTKYRLILTINPYCSNILFNTVTEIVQNEGTDNINDLKIANATPIEEITIKNYDINGKTNNVTNTDMVRNTEYSNGDTPFEYHCGFDIFNNHILRNRTFKLVCSYKSTPMGKINTTDTITENVYNTIRDYMRNEEGDNIKLKRRINIGRIDEKTNKHLYLKEDILSFIDSINENLTEQNGWWGFNNRSCIPSCENKNNKWEDLKISKVFNGKNMNSIDKNDRMACEFIEMYPDSSLYSFSPKYNRFQNREEHNWDICITYPYENDESTDKILINGRMEDGTVINSLLLAEVNFTKGTSTQNIILFRSYVKHNLKVYDKFKLFYNEKNSQGKGEFKEFEGKDFLVVNIGDLNNNYKDYYFYINDYNDIIEELGEDLSNYDFRFIKVVNGRNCKYYYRKFKKLPNFRLKKEELTDEIAEDRELFEKYVRNNCTVGEDNDKKMLLFNREQYPLAFSKTIYGDSNTQIVFTDSIEIDKLKDNLGRPLTELYMTFIKRNKGHDLWYKTSKDPNDMKEIEFSHCFGKVISGLEMHIEKTDSDKIKENRKELGDCTLLYNDISNNALDEDIDIDKKDIFYGDVVELDRYTMTETVLSDVHFRFNTEQREHDFKDGELNCGIFKYDEIETDDYDLKGFECNENDATSLNNINQVLRREGYHYKAHYPIKVREFGTIRQGSHKEIDVVTCRPRQANGLFIEVVSSLQSGANSNGIAYLCDGESGEILNELRVNSVLSNVRFLLNPLKKDVKKYKSIYDIVNGLLYSERNLVKGNKWVDEHGIEHIVEKETENVKDYSRPKYILRIKNIDIPNYAYNVGNNIYLWRDVLNVGNKDALLLEEYPFANGHFYINKNINFFLKRQDPFGDNDLYADDLVPNDIYGNIKGESIYEYKDETNVVC